MPFGAVVSVSPNPGAPCNAIACEGVSEKYNSALLSDVADAALERRERTITTGTPDGGAEYVVSVTVPDPVIAGSVIAPLSALPDGKVTDAGAGFAENVVEFVLCGDCVLGEDGVCVLCGVGVTGVPPPPPPHAASAHDAARIAKTRIVIRGKNRGTTPSSKRAGVTLFAS